MSDSPQAVSVRINGEDREIAAPCSIAGLLDSLRVSRTHTAVERNRQIVPKSDFERVMLEDGDVLEIVTLVGGG